MSYCGKFTGKGLSLFTLIELLVVIAIIAILASMLMPALSKARDRAKLATCQVNIKTLGNWSFTYGDQFNDFVLPAGVNYMPGNISLEAIFGTTPATGPYGNGNNIKGSYFNMFRCLKYTSNIKAYVYCPKDTTSRDVYNGWTTYGIVSSAEYPSRYKNTYYWWRYNQIHNPSKKIYFTEGISNLEKRNGYFRINSKGSNSDGSRAVPWNWHDNMTTVGFIDGHVEAVQRVTMTYHNSLWHLVNDTYMGYARP